MLNRIIIIIINQYPYINNYYNPTINLRYSYLKEKIKHFFMSYTLRTDPSIDSCFVVGILHLLMMIFEIKSKALKR